MHVKSSIYFFFIFFFLQNISALKKYERFVGKNKNMEFLKKQFFFKMKQLYICTLDY